MNRVPEFGLTYKEAQRGATKAEYKTCRDRILASCVLTLVNIYARHSEGQDKTSD